MKWVKNYLGIWVREDDWQLAMTDTAKWFLPNNIYDGQPLYGMRWVPLYYGYDPASKEEETQTIDELISNSQKHLVERTKMIDKLIEDSRNHK